MIFLRLWLALFLTTLGLTGTVLLLIFLTGWPGLALVGTTALAAIGALGINIDGSRT